MHHFRILGRFPADRRRRFNPGLVLAALCAAAGASTFAQPARLDGPPRVLRTFTHHQVTADPRGVSGFRPILSDDGSRIVFGLVPAADGQPYRLAAAGYEGDGLAVLDTDPGNGITDITADGKRIVYVAENEIRSIAADGSDRRTLFKPYAGQIDAIRISGNGRVVVFLVSRGLTLKEGEQYREALRGVFAVDSDGRNFRRVSGPEEVGRVRGVPADQVGNPNFTLGFRMGSIDVSTDGSRVVFGCWVPGANALFGCGLDGSGLRTVAEFKAEGGQPKEFLSIALSGDGRTVAWQATYPNELGVVAFEGGALNVLQKSGPEDRRYGWGSSVPVYVTLDGARVTYEGRTYDTRGGGVVQLMSTHQEGILRYYEYEQMSPDGAARRFAYRAYGPAPYQLASMELNVPVERLRGAPRVSELLVDPPSIPRQVRDVVIALPLLAARVAAEPPSPGVSSSGFRDGILDETMAQYGRVGQTDLYDDGAGDQQTQSGDVRGGDGIFSRRWLAAYAEAPDGPRTVRVEAQVTGTDGRRRASVVEIGPYPVVPGTADRPPAGGATPIDGRPPEPPAVDPRPPGIGPGGPVGDGGGGPGGGPGSGGGGPGGGGPGGGGPGGAGGGAIDLTGYWISESGALHFVRQIGAKVYWSVEFLPRVRNVYAGTIDGSAITGTWVDLPGGEIETGTGTLVLRIESNDRLSKISDSPAYDAGVWTRVGRPAGGGTGAGTGPGASDAGAGGGLPPGPATFPPPSAAPDPWQTPAGRALIDQWALEATTRLNVYEGGPEFNRRKPYSINKYGLLAGTGLSSASAPDGFVERANDRYWYMWDIWIPYPSGWRYPEWNAAGVPPLREYVLRRLGGGR